MLAWTLRRAVAGLVTLAVLSVIVFVASQVLPGDVGRSILGPFASQDAVAQLNAELGTDDPVLVQYGRWVGGVLGGDLGTSQVLRRPVADMLGPALVTSGKLALLALVLVVPLSIAGGVLAALRAGRASDRAISTVGLAMSSTPDFVWAVVAITIFGLGLGIFPVTARAPDGAGALEQIHHLMMPALCLVAMLFGYITRMVRAGTIEALEADYTRTAMLKGLPRRTVIRRHVLRNSLLPTIYVTATELGYLVGGLVAIELIFNSPGVGQLLYRAAEQKDLPLLQSAVLVIGALYLVVTFLADLLYALLNPRVRQEGLA